MTHSLARIHTPKICLLCVREFFSKHRLTMEKIHQMKEEQNEKFRKLEKEHQEEIQKLDQMAAKISSD
jgi:hypothetical protein